jgi:hypothetical protein
MIIEPILGKTLEEEYSIINKYSKHLIPIMLKDRSKIQTNKFTQQENYEAN